MSEVKADEKDRPAVQSTQAAESAPANNDKTAAGGSIEAPQAKTTEESKEPPKGAQVEFFKLREQRRELRETVAQKEQALAERDAKLAALQARLEALEKAPKDASRSEKKSEEPDIFEDPKAALEKVKLDAVELIRQEREAEKRRAELDKAQQEAGEMLLTRSHITQDPNFAREVAGLLHEGGRYSRLANEDPQAAAELAYLAVCKAKGVVPDLSVNKSHAAQSAASGIKPSAAGVGEKPVITAKDVREGKYSEEDVRKAVAEGRYQGKLYKIGA